MFDVQVPFSYAAAISSGGATARVATLGNNPDIDTTSQPEDVWSGAELGVLNGVDHRFIPKPQIATNMEIVSDSANDTSAGTGARTAILTYLDANYTQKTVVLTLNGLTPVAIADPIMRINGLVVVSSGTFGGNNVGNLSVRAAGGLGATYSYMLAGHGIARSSMFTTPAKLQTDVLSLLISINQTDTSARAAVFSLCIQNQAGRLLKGLELACTSSAPYRHEAVNVPLNVLAEKTDIWVRCEAVSVSNTNVTAAIFGYTRNLVNFTL
jgi:hypothetical protein